jgi:hypothetical protein
MRRVGGRQGQRLVVSAVVAHVMAAVMAAVMIPLTSVGHARADVGADAPDLAELSALHRLGPVGIAGDASAAPLSIAVAGGYGFTEAVLGRDDRHHRLLGTLAAEWAASRSWHLGLGLTGRYDRHQIGAAPQDSADAAAPSSDDGWTGEPQLGLRWGHALDPATQAGVSLEVNFPGSNAPSIEPKAIGGALVASAARKAGHFAFLGALGYRLDRSARAAPSADRLSPADRVSLGINAFDAVVAGLGARHRHRDLTLFAEASVEALLGSGHPPAAQWPMHLGLGARHPLSATIAGEIAAELSPSARPSLARNAPLVDLPPRITLLVGLLWSGPRTGQGERISPPPPLTPAPPAAAPVAPAPPTEAPLPTGQLRCVVRSFGGVGISAQLRIVGAADSAAPAAAAIAPLHSRDGTFTVELTPGSYEVSIEAERFVPQHRTITIEKNGVTLLNADLRRAK